MKTFLDDKLTFLVLGYESDHSKINEIVKNLMIVAENNFPLFQSLHLSDDDLNVSEFSDVDENYMRFVLEHRLNQLYWKKLFNEYAVCNKVCFEKYKELCNTYNAHGDRITTPNFNKNDAVRFLTKHNISI